MISFRLNDATITYTICKDMDKQNVARHENDAIDRLQTFNYTLHLIDGIRDNIQHLILNDFNVTMTWKIYHRDILRYLADKTRYLKHLQRYKNVRMCEWSNRSSECSVDTINVSKTFFKTNIRCSKHPFYDIYTNKIDSHNNIILIN